METNKRESYMMWLANIAYLCYYVSSHDVKAQYNLVNMHLGHYIVGGKAITKHLVEEFFVKLYSKRLM